LICFFTTSLALTLSPRRGNSHRPFSDRSARIRQSLTHNIPKTGKQFSFSSGEKVGMRAGIQTIRVQSVAKNWFLAENKKRPAGFSGAFAF
jgi:hypothetical protein